MKAGMSGKKISLYDLWWVSPQCFVFIRGKDGKVREYRGNGPDSDKTVNWVLATKYPMYDHVLEVKLDD